MEIISNEKNFSSVSILYFKDPTGTSCEKCNFKSCLHERFFFQSFSSWSLRLSKQLIKVHQSTVQYSFRQMIRKSIHSITFVRMRKIAAKIARVNSPSGSSAGNWTRGLAKPRRKVCWQVLGQLDVYWTNWQPLFMSMAIMDCPSVWKNAVKNWFFKIGCSKNGWTPAWPKAWMVEVYFTHLIIIKLCI